MKKIFLSIAFATALATSASAESQFMAATRADSAANQAYHNSLKNDPALARANAQTNATRAWADAQHAKAVADMDAWENRVRNRTPLVVGGGRVPNPRPPVTP